MGLKLCTLTGADLYTPMSQMVDISEQYPFVEWAILYHPEKTFAKEGKSGYPPFDWIYDFLYAQVSFDLNCSFHICTPKGIENFCTDEDRIAAIAANFKRIQLNFNQQDVDLEALKKRINSLSHAHPQVQIIIQHNEANHDLWQKLNVYPNVAVLFDGSRGKGISPQKWNTPLPFLQCGYAGGLGLDNLEEQLPLIEAASLNQDYWIDMQMKLRTAEITDVIFDYFDLEKAKRVLEIVKRHLAKNEKGLLSQPYPEGDMSSLFVDARYSN